MDHRKLGRWLVKAGLILFFAVPLVLIAAAWVMKALGFEAPVSLMAHVTLIAMEVPALGLIIILGGIAVMKLPDED